MHPATQNVHRAAAYARAIALADRELAQEAHRQAETLASTQMWLLALNRARDTHRIEREPVRKEYVYPRA